MKFLLVILFSFALIQNACIAFAADHSDCRYRGIFVRPHAEGPSIALKVIMTQVEDRFKKDYPKSQFKDYEVTTTILQDKSSIQVFLYESFGKDGFLIEAKLAAGKVQNITILKSVVKEATSPDEDPIARERITE